MDTETHSDDMDNGRVYIYLNVVATMNGVGICKVFKVCQSGNVIWIVKAKSKCSTKILGHFSVAQNFKNLVLKLDMLLGYNIVYIYIFSDFF
jgi:hypothetical protein